MGRKNENIHKFGPPGGFYLVTYIGVLIYYFNQADGAWDVILAFFQALVWPAILVYSIFQSLGA